MAWGINNNGWWREGEVQIFRRSVVRGQVHTTGMQTASTRHIQPPFYGEDQVLQPEGLYNSQQRYAM